MDKSLRNTIIASLFIISFSVFYYFVIFIPRNARANLARQEQKEVEEQQKMQECRRSAKEKDNFKSVEEIRLFLDVCMKAGPNQNEK